MAKYPHIATLEGFFDDGTPVPELGFIKKLYRKAKKGTRKLKKVVRKADRITKKGLKVYRKYTPMSVRKKISSTLNLKNLSKNVPYGDKVYKTYKVARKLKKSFIDKPKKEKNVKRLKNKIMSKRHSQRHDKRYGTVSRTRTGKIDWKKERSKSAILAWKRANPGKEPVKPEKEKETNWIIPAVAAAGIAALALL